MVAKAENLTVNEYTSVGGTGYTYDANGNLTSDGTYTFEYDAFNRLVRVKQAATTVAEYLYDAANRRIRKTVGYEEYQYVYGGWQVLEEYYSVPAKEYFDNLYRRFTYGEYIDEPVVMECDKNLDGDFADTNETLYYSSNNTYNVSAMFNASGDIVEHYRYDPYGKATIYTGKGADNTWFTSDDVSSSVSAVGNPYTFTGRRLDTETGLMYFRNRYYSVDLGRFISRDALEYVDGWNLYRGYFAVNGMDPLGLEETHERIIWPWRWGDMHVSVVYDFDKCTASVSGVTMTGFSGLSVTVGTSYGRISGILGFHIIHSVVTNWKPCHQLIDKKGCGAWTHIKSGKQCVIEFKIEVYKVCIGFTYGPYEKSFRKYGPCLYSSEREL